jgi:hypothetical protein
LDDEDDDKFLRDVKKSSEDRTFGTGIVDATSGNLDDLFKL